MTTFAPQAAPGRWMSAAELAQESGLRQDLVTRFVPANDRGPMPLYSADQIPLAQFIKKLTDISAPPGAIDVAVRDLMDPAGAQDRSSRAGSRPGIVSRMSAPMLGIVAASLTILSLAGGWALGSAGVGSKTESVRSAPVTVTADAPPVDAPIPAVPDRACADWASINNGFLKNTKRMDWMATDPNIPAAEWSSQQRALTVAVIPTMTDEAAQVAALAERAAAPELRMILQLRAAYEVKFTERLPNYVVSDHALWEAVSDFGNAATSFCTAMAPR